MAKDKRKTYYVRWEYEAWSYGEKKGEIIVPAVVKETEFLWIKRNVAGPFKDFKEAGDYVYNVLHGKLTKRQHKDIYGTKRP